MMELSTKTTNQLKRELAHNGHKSKRDKLIRREISDRVRWGWNTGWDESW
jgi:hypothetical protein